MPDYKELYLHLFRATEKATEILITAQRECEELYLAEADPALKLLTLPLAMEKSMVEE